MNHDLMTATEVAATLDVSPMTVRRWARSGKLRAIRLGRAWGIPRADVDTLKEQQQ